MKDVSPAPDDALTEVIAPRDAFRIALPNFEGPLDLLLHLIREHGGDLAVHLDATLGDHDLGVTA